MHMSSLRRSMPIGMVRHPDTISVSQPSESRKLENTPELSVLRIKPRKRGWVPISRALIDDVRLQFDTRAIASWLIAKPDRWEIRLVALPYLLQQRAGRVNTWAGTAGAAVGRFPVNRWRFSGRRFA